MIAATERDFARAGKQNALTVSAPPYNSVSSGMPGKVLRLTAIDADDVDVGVAVLARCERDGLTIRREYRPSFVGGVSGKALRMLAVAIGDPDVTGVHKCQVISRNGGLPNQHCLRSLSSRAH